MNKLKQLKTRQKQLTKQVSQLQEELELVGRDIFSIELKEKVEEGSIYCTQCMSVAKRIVNTMPFCGTHPS